MTVILAHIAAQPITHGKSTKERNFIAGAAYTASRKSKVQLAERKNFICGFEYSQRVLKD